MENDNYLTENWTDTFLNERMMSPRIWKTLNNGFEIKELKSNKIDDVIKIIKEYYIKEEISMVSCHLHIDKESIDNYLYLARHWMMDTISIIAVKQGTENIVGFLICRFNQLSKHDHQFSKEMIFTDEKCTELQTFKHYLKKSSNVYKHYNVDSILEVYSWYVLPDYRNKGIGSELLNNVILKQMPEYEWFKTNVIIGIFTSTISQNIAESLGMKTFYEFNYNKWIVKDKETGENRQFFQKYIPDNYSAKLMVMQIDYNSSQKKS